MKIKYKLSEKTEAEERYNRSVPPPLRSDYNANKKSILRNKSILTKCFIFSIAFVIAIVAYFGYNEYVYNKIGVCFSEGNVALAEHYSNSISPSYKDVEKVKNLIHSYNNFDVKNSNDYNRVITILESYKGFKNQNINYFYNNFYMNVITLSGKNTSSGYNTDTYHDDSTDFYTSTTVATTEKITYTSEPTIGYTTDSNYEDYNIITTVSATVPSAPHDEIIVYYVESGEVYHINRDCRSLARSTNVFSGPVPENRRACKICSEG